MLITCDNEIGLRFFGTFKLNITQGCEVGICCPSNDVLRDQMAAFLARAFLGMP
jgi:hypothetical protein